MPSGRIRGQIDAPISAFFFPVLGLISLLLLSAFLFQSLRRVDLSGKPDMSFAATADYSVWAMPPEPLKERLQKVMEKLSDEFGGPAFEPHVTVVGAIRLSENDAREKLQSSCQGMKPYTVRIKSFDRGTFFYRCVYLLVEPTDQVVEASENACNHFGYQRSSPYMPHLSLLYGDLTDDEKDKARERVKFHDPDICDISFEVSKLTLCKTDTDDKTLKSWEKIVECDLTGRN